jgi:hypothetical protein
MLVAQGLGLLAGLLFGRDGGWVERAFVWGSLGYTDRDAG